MGRLADKLTQAAGVAKRVSDSIEARADAIIAREAHVKSREEAAFAPHENLLSGAEKGLDEVEAAIRQLSNAPLEG